MCSVCGIATRHNGARTGRSVRQVLEMLRRTAHRGPDGAGLWANGRRVTATTLRELASNGATLEGRIVLAQSRLAITGTSDALQPFTSRDGRVALAHNGEVYNHHELARLTRLKGYEAGRSDSEVLLHVVEAQLDATGGDLAEAVRRAVHVASGMYALAVTDGRIVVLVRDPVGKKPLHYVAGREAFAWASERKALVDVAREQGRPIERVPPGHLLVCDENLSLRSERVERLSPPAVDIHDAGTAVDEYGRALAASVARRTRGLRRAAVLFSGGIDSVLVAHVVRQAGVEVTGYVSGVRDSNDVRFATQIARRIGIPVRVVAIDEDDVERELPSILEHTELHGPLMAEVSLPMWFAARAAHDDGHRVIFTGQAADELFAGYSWYRQVVQDHGHLTLHARLWEDLERLPLDTLEREDRITMAWALEMRAPYLDEDVVRTAFRIAPNLKLSGPDDSFGKLPHRALAHRLGIARDIAWRKKEPAQDGANVHALLERVAARRRPTAARASAPPDFGSNYRYRDTPGRYATDAVHALLQETVRRGGFVVAGADGSAEAPALDTVGSTMRSAATPALARVAPRTSKPGGA